MTSLLNKLLILTLTAALISACSSAPKKEPTEQELYEDAKKSIKLRNFSQATIALEELEAKYPFGTYAEQAQLDLIYARYSALDLDGSILAADRFIRLHPQSPSVDYAYYIKGIANYHLDIGVASQYFSAVDVSSRDPGNMRQAFSDFSELITRFPDSQYAADAQKRMIDIRNRLASYEMHAARYYIRREAYVAAANRAAYVVQNFPKTPVVEEALMLMVEVYQHLELDPQADKALAVLQLNFPDSAAFDQEGKFVPKFIQEQRRSLLSVVSFGFLD
ncbi:MAG: outer membrane protein assembly factor BamD [Oleiphilus sp.]|nr:MAG: outer membrane protein assembly factor BamD [Oleiphilus sp.]